MAKEVVITSVPRGIKLGRTGFQVVMRTAGTVDGVLSSLEQLGGYRHVHPQGSGRNPLIYSYRVVRGNTGQLNVLGRTVDAGNDFSNRSNKLAHLLAIDPGELSALRNSSPAAVLAAIDGRLAIAWQGGPEERPSPFALPAPPVQPATCRRWNDVKGDAGWGGLLAQRAMRGQATLVIAPDCSPTWSRRLLDLFQEVLALLPPDGRWKTTFETMVIGSSTSVLRGTYAGSPESATGHAGLLVVDLSQRSPLPANVAPDELIKTAREGPKQAVGKAPPIPDGRGTPPVPVSGFETGSITTGGLQPVGPTGPVRPPMTWSDDDEDKPRSRLGWYIGGGIVLLGMVLVSALVGGWYWFDDLTTKKLRQRFLDYARIADGNEPQIGEEKALALADWHRAYRDDKASIGLPEAAFPILLSALRTQAVNATTIQDPNTRGNLVAAAKALAVGQSDEAKLLDYSATLGLVVPKDMDDAKIKAAATFLSGWLADRSSPDKAISLQDFASLQTRINLASEFINVAYLRPDEPERKTRLQKVVPSIWPGVPDKAAPADWIDVFARTLDLTRDPPKVDFKNVSSLLASATKPEPKALSPDVDKTPPEIEAAKASQAQQAFLNLCKALKTYEPKQPKDCAEVVLAKDVDAANLRLKVELPSCGKWRPKAEPDSVSKPARWGLKGLPDDSTAEWGTLVLDDKDNLLKFTRTQVTGPQDGHDPLYVPIRFSLEGSLEKSNPVVIAATEKTSFQRRSDQSLFSLIESGTLTLQTEKPLVSSHALDSGLATKLVTQTISGLRLTQRKTEAAGINVELVALKPKEFETSISDIWLESFQGTPDRNEKNNLVLCVRCDDRRPWTRRDSRLGELSLPRKQCNQDKWLDIVKRLLDTSPYEDLHGTVNEKARPFVERWLGGEPKDDSGRKNRTQLVNRLSTNGVPEWYGQACYFLFKDPGPYQRWTYEVVRKDQGIDRPRDDPEPRQPEKNAPKEKLEEFQRNKRHWDDNQQILRRWNARYFETFYSSANILAFLRRPPDHQDLDLPGLSACRAAAVVVLELAAKHVAEKEKNAMETTPLGSLFSVSLALPWVFEDGAEKSVDRLTIQPAVLEKQPEEPTRSPQQPPDINSPTASTPSNE